jgi:carbon starvation protein
MGIVDRLWHPPLWLLTIVFVPATLVAVWLGTEFSTALILDRRTWALLILAYCFVASLVPVWVLLQPRGYLGGFVLYLALFVGTVGLLFGGLEIKQAAFKGWQASGPTGALFPFLFVTIACGACSGFHGLVCSGTTSKQIRSEPDCRPIGYGAMLLEAFVALVALATVMIVDSNAVAGRAPGVIYGDGLGRFVAMIIGEDHQRLAATFGAMAFSTFVFDTLDVSTRLGRYVVQELLGWTSRAGAIAATALTIGPPAVLVVVSGEGAYRTFWTLFGTANQLLAALTLLAISVWLRRTGRAYWYTAFPMAFVMTVTLWSLAVLARQPLSGWIGGAQLEMAVVLNGIVAFVLIGLALVLLREGWRAAQQEA